MVLVCISTMGFPGGSSDKESPANVDLIPESEDSLENGNNSSVSCLKNPWTTGPSGLQSMGVAKVSHNLAAKQQQYQYHYCPHQNLHSHPKENGSKTIILHPSFGHVHI